MSEPLLSTCTSHHLRFLSFCGVTDERASERASRHDEARMVHVARRMDFLSGARALWGLRRSLIFARGEGHQRADISSPPQSESRTRAWQVMGRLRMRFLVVCGMHKRRVGQARKRRMSTRVAARMPSEAPTLLVSSWGSHKILKLFASQASVMVFG